MELEVNKEAVNFPEGYKVGNNLVMITPPLKDNFVVRVHLFKDQYINAFSKFGTIGIGFAIEEEDWNTNLPYDEDSEVIYKHISGNKKYDEITKEECIKAIGMIKDFIDGNDQQGGL